MNWNTAGDSKAAIENAIREIDALIRKFNSTYLILDNNEDSLSSIVEGLKKVSRELISLEEDLLDESLTMGRIDSVFK